MLVDSISVDDRGNTSSGSVVLESQTDYLFVASGTTTIDTKGRIGNSYNWQLDQRGRPYTTSPRTNYGLALSLDEAAPAKPNWMADVALLSVLNEPTRVPGVQTSTFVIQRTGMGQPARIRFLDTPYDDNGGRWFTVSIYAQVLTDVNVDRNNDGAIVKSSDDPDAAATILNPYGAKEAQSPGKIIGTDKLRHPVDLQITLPGGSSSTGYEVSLHYDLSVSLFKQQIAPDDGGNNTDLVVSGVLPLSMFDWSGNVGKLTLYMEGKSDGVSTIHLGITGPRSYALDVARVSVVGIDYDIDSDNDNGFNFPEGDEWEEYLEDNIYGIGKMVSPSDSHFTPTRLRLTPWLDTSPESPLRVKFDFEIMGQSGEAWLWNAPKADLNRINDDILAGGNRVFPGQNYTLSQLNYDPATGAITIWLESRRVHRGRHSTKEEIEAFGKPDDRIEATLVVSGKELLSDEVKYMSVIPDTFYPHLQAKEEIRNALASEDVYELTGDHKYSLKLLDDAALNELGVPLDVIALIGEPAFVPGFKSAIYLDHVSGKYVLAFAGTDDLNDVMVDIWQGLGGFTLQYAKSMYIARALKALNRFEYNTVTTGHSLGGGLASAASVVSGFHADTFNAAGLSRDVLLYDLQGNPIAGNPFELFRYDFASNFIDAYYLDWDLLSAVQDATPLQDAIGRRIEMDGPLDFDIGLSFAFLSAQLASGAGWFTVFGSLGSLGYDMGLCHVTYYYHYGLMVDEETGWDIYGYDDF